MNDKLKQVREALEASLKHIRSKAVSDYGLECEIESTLSTLWQIAEWNNKPMNLIEKMVMALEEWCSAKHQHCSTKTDDEYEAAAIRTEKAEDRLQQALTAYQAEKDIEEQISAELCDVCGWKMKFPGEECRNCGYNRLRKLYEVEQGQYVRVRKDRLYAAESVGELAVRSKSIEEWKAYLTEGSNDG